MNEEEDIRGGATDEQINQAYKEAKINEQRDPRTDEKFLEKRAKKNKIKGFDSSESMLDEEFEAQKQLQEDDLTAEQEFRDANRGIDIMYEVGKTADSILGSGGTLGQIFDFLKGKSEGKDVEFPVQLLLKEQKDLPKDDTKGTLPEGDETNFLSRVFSTGRGGEIDKGIVEFLESIIRPTTKRRRRRRRSNQAPGQLYIDFSYSNLNEQIEKEPQLTDEDLTDEERIKYGQMNAESAISLEDYLTQFGASTISRKRIKTYMLEPFKAKYGATDAQVKEYVKLANRNTRDIEATIKYLNYEYKLARPAVDIDDIAAEMSLLFGQDITPETIDAIIQGQGGKILYQTDGMKRRKEDPIEITDRESLLNAYVARLNLLNTHGAFDKGHVYAADQILRDNKVSNASMFRNL